MDVSNYIITKSKLIIICCIFAMVGTGCGGGSDLKDSFPEASQFSVCGNGILEANEQCDQGDNNTNSDCSDSNNYNCYLCDTSCNEQFGASKLLDDSNKAILALDSYSFSFTGEECDVSETPGISCTSYTAMYKFMNGYYIYEDYDFEQTTDFTAKYNPQRNKNVVYVYVNNAILGIPRPIDSEEASSILKSSWQFHLMQHEVLSQDVTPIYEGLENIRGKSAYKISFVFTSNEKPEEHDIEISAYSVPDELLSGYSNQLLSPVNEDYGKLTVWLDKQTLFIVSELVERSNGEQYYRKDWYDITTNTLTIDDF